MEPAHHPVRARRLRVGVALIIVWWVPIWALGPRIAESIGGPDGPPSGAAVTTVILVVQTIIGLIGFWAAGSEVKSIVQHASKRQAFAAVWSVLIHGEIPGHEPAAGSPEEQPPAEQQPPAEEQRPAEQQPPQGPGDQ